MRKPGAPSSPSGVPGYLLLGGESLTFSPAVSLWVDVEAFEEAATTARHALAGSYYEGRPAAARSQLDGEVWGQAWEEGKAMPLECAVEYALFEEEEPSRLFPSGEPPPADEPAETLTRRERKVAHLVARGLTNRQIASELSVSRNTANNHVARILRKVGLRSRVQLTAWVTGQRSASSERDPCIFPPEGHYEGEPSLPRLTAKMINRNYALVLSS